ncbi:hypothetical protein CDD81_1015 [Ophiocordyceps australis]|uniref:Uncharacterized protein n=1 Tax=Ophiocordyceps australis TaxID=1399860 RepID=A0A2C5XFQ1_9HYPO|nr:hypothetical protein CDD81_1015 [Ophiocordyceps australis]
MTSLDFSTSLSGAARVEKIKQMTQNHPATEKSRHTLSMLYRAQQALQQLPPGQHAQQVALTIQEVGRVVQRETAHLVEALTNVTLDQQDTDKAIARMSLEANLIKARTDDQAQKISDLEKEVKSEREKRLKAEEEARKARDSLKTLGADGCKSGEASGKEREESSDELVNVGESAISPVTPAQKTGVKNDKGHGGTRAQSEDDDSLGSEQANKGGYEGGALVISNSNTPRLGSDLLYGDRLRCPGGMLMAGIAPRAPAAMVNEEGRLMQQQQQQQQQWWKGARGSKTSTPGSALSQVPRGRSNFERGEVNYGYNYSPVSGYGGMEGASRWFGQRRDMGWNGAMYDNGLGLNRGMGMGGDDMGMGLWSEQVMDFYGAIRDFVERHASDAAVGRVRELRNSSLWPLLVAAYHPLGESDVASYLEVHLRSERAKACVVTRVLVGFVLGTLWTAGAWAGFDSQTTYQLLELERELQATQGQTLGVRQPLLNQQASLVQSILLHHGTFAWQQGKIGDAARRLHATVQPLLNRLVSPGESERDARRVADMAWRMSARLLSSRLAFDFRFPHVGARFALQCMLPIWPHVEPIELQAKHWRVALAVTPIITCRSQVAGSVSAHCVALADVFCMN